MISQQTRLRRRLRSSRHEERSDKINDGPMEYNDAAQSRRKLKKESVKKKWQKKEDATETPDQSKPEDKSGKDANNGSQSTSNTMRKKDAGFDNGRAWPAVDPEEKKGHVENPGDDDSNIESGADVVKKGDKTSKQNGRDSDSQDDDTSAVQEEVETEASGGSNENKIEDEDTLGNKNKGNQNMTSTIIETEKTDSDSFTELDGSEVATDKKNISYFCAPMESGHGNLPVKMGCIASYIISVHPAGSMTAFLTIFFFCYCACRGRRSKRFTGRDRKGDYSAVDMYDELLDDFDDDLASFSHNSEDSIGTILSNWSGKVGDKKLEMAKFEDENDSRLSLSEVNG